jgi:hypothetical protein
MRPIAVLLVVAWAFALSSCWAPYYDPEVSASAKFADSLGEPLLSIGPLSASGMFDPSAGGRFEFLPERPYGDPASPAEGFLVQKGEDRARVAFVAYSSGYGFASMSMDMSNYFGSGALLRAEASTSGDYPQMIAITDHQVVRQYRFDRSAQSLVESETANTDLTCSRIYGAGAALSTIASDADKYWILYDGGSQVLLSAGTVDSALGTFYDMGVTPATGGRSLGNGGRMLSDMSGGSYYYSPPGDPTLLWSAASLSVSAPEELSISRPLVAVLSDGTLVAQDELHLSAYTAGGKELFTVLAGSIRLQHEVYSYGPSPEAGYYLIFTQVLEKGSSNSDSREFRIKVWRVSLAEFHKLG